VKVHATFAQPHQYSTGFDWVIVNGRPAVENGKPNGQTHGKVLRKKTD
jgi:N-acyl-D-amino-acid deacylase